MKALATKIIKSAIWESSPHIKTLIWLLSQEDKGLVTISVKDYSEDKLKRLIEIVDFLKGDGFCEYTISRTSLRVVFSFHIDNVIIDDKGLDAFMPFVKAYPGTKREAATEFAVFKKHKDWKTILPTLLHSLDRQIKERERAKLLGSFVPPWKHLQTYLRNRGWEEVISAQETAQVNVIRPRGK